MLFDMLQVIRRLREFNEPILLFGEAEYGAFVRLKKLESAEPDFSKVCFASILGYDRIMCLMMPTFLYINLTGCQVLNNDKLWKLFNHTTDFGLSCVQYPAEKMQQFKQYFG